MRLRFGLSLVLGLTLGLGGWPAIAQNTPKTTAPKTTVSDAQVTALVDALVAAAGPTEGTPTYTDWQTQNIPVWSNQCIGRSLTVSQFAASPVTARWISVCALRTALTDQLKASNNNLETAVRRTAAWWLNGQPDRYQNGDTATYTKTVWQRYAVTSKAAAATAAAKPATAIAQPPNPQPTPKPAEKPTEKPTEKSTTTTAEKPTEKPAEKSTTTAASALYDRYMKAGYEATNRRDHETALLYFKRALDERPQDTYATQAVQNVQSYIKQPQPATGTQPSPTPPPQPQPEAAAPKNKPSTARLTPPPKAPTTPTVTPTKGPTATIFVPAEPPAAAFSEQQAIDLVTRWLQAKVEIFAPPFDQQQVLNLTTGELLASLVKPNGVLNWLKTNQAYYRYGVQKVEAVERFAVARDRATIEVQLVEDRTLYFNGTIDPNRTAFTTQRVRFTLAAIDGTWKIADYKTVDGLLLERSVLEASSNAANR